MAAPPLLRRFDDDAVEYVPLTSAPGVETRIKAIAFYLPQFHPIPENDRVVGQGLHRVDERRARPAAVRRPLPAAPAGRARLLRPARSSTCSGARSSWRKAYGLHGFCYHHYWFGGKRLLRQPLDQLLANPDLDFPFCLCWANENWTRRWDGRDDEILIAQQHSPEDDLAFIRDIEPALRDARYIRVDGPAAAGRLPPGAAARCRARRPSAGATTAATPGIGELFLVSHPGLRPPQPARASASTRRWSSRRTTWARRRSPREVPRVNPDFQRHRSTTTAIWSSAAAQLRAAGRLPAVPQRDADVGQRGAAAGRGAVFAGSSPALYREWLENACRYTLEHIGADKPFVFVNAWNEWAEGAHLEPDRATATRTCRRPPTRLRKFPARRRRPSIVVVSHDAHFHGAQRLGARSWRRRWPGGWATTSRSCCAATGRSRHGSRRPVRCTTSLDRRRRPRSGSGSSASCTTAAPASRSATPASSAARSELLKSAGFRVVSMIHELPGLIGDYSLEESIATIARHADRSSFRPAVVRDRFVGADAPGPEKAVVRPQGLLAANRFGGPATTRRAASCGRGWAWTRRRGSCWQSATPTIARASTCSSTSAFASWTSSRTSRVRVGRPSTTAMALRPAAQRVEHAGADGPVRLPGSDRGHRPVLRRRRRLPDDVARGSVSAASCCTPSTPSCRSSASTVPAVSSSSCSADCGVLVPYLDTDGDGRRRQTAARRPRRRRAA